MNKSKSIDMINGPLLKNIIAFSIPLMITNALNMVFNAADTIVVGQFAGDTALAAVGATGSLVFLMQALFIGLSMGSNVVVANAYGSDDKDKIKKAVHTSIYLGVASGLFLSFLGFFACKAALRMMSTPESIIDLSATYMRIYYLGSVFNIVYNFGSAILRAKGDTKRPLYFLTISGVLNVILNLVFVMIFKMSVVGVALATVISQGVSCILLINALLNETDYTRLIVKEIRLDVPTAIDIIKIGVPSGVGSMAFSISNVVVQSSINSFDSDIVIAGNSVASNVENFVYIGMMAFSSAVVTFTSQNIGARRIDNVKKVFWLGMLLDVALSLVSGTVVYLAAKPLLSLYTSSLEVIEMGVFRLFWVAFFLFLNAILDIFTNSLRGMGYSTSPTILMLVGVCGVRLLWLWTYFPAHREIGVVYMCYPISWFIASILEGILWMICLKKKANELETKLA